MRARRVGQRVDSLLHEISVVDVALLNPDQWTQQTLGQLLDRRFDLHLAELVEIALIHREGQVESPAVGRQLSDGGHDMKVGVSVADIEAPELLAVEGKAIRIVIVVRRKKFVPSAFLGRDLRTQRAVVADRRDSGAAG